MTCENEQANLQRASAAASNAAGQCASLCASLEFNSPECRACREQVDNLRREVVLAEEALHKCLADNPPAATARLLGLEGHVTFLLVVEQGSGYGGGSSNWIDADVIFKLDSRPDKSFGFQLRDDPFQPVRRGMLALLRDAMVHGLKVKTDYSELIMPPNQNSFVLRVALTKLPEPSSGGGLTTNF